jgi:hypothetical protein
MAPPSSIRKRMSRSGFSTLSDQARLFDLRQKARIARRVEQRLPHHLGRAVDQLPARAAHQAHAAVLTARSALHQLAAQQPRALFGGEGGLSVGPGASERMTEAAREDEEATQRGEARTHRHRRQGSASPSTLHAGGRSARGGPGRKRRFTERS